VTIGEQFLWGCVGSLAVEIVKIHWLYGMARRLPVRYRSPVFWVARSLLALTGGSLAVAYRIETPVLALHLGAATPLIVQALAQNVGRLLAEQDEEKSDGKAVPEKPERPRQGVCPQCRRQTPKETRPTPRKRQTRRPEERAATTRARSFGSRGWYG
jgi:hypothetical protein